MTHFEQQYGEYVGTSPAGVRWVAYRPGDAAKLRRRLAGLWRQQRARDERDGCSRPGCGLPESVHGHGETGRDDSHPFERSSR